MDFVDMFVVGASPGTKNKEHYFEVMLQDRQGFKYGPLRITAGKLYASWPQSEANARELRSRLAAAFPESRPVIKPYGRHQNVVWLHTSTEIEQEKVWREFEPKLRQITTSQRIANGMGWPLPVVSIPIQLYAALEKQSQVHSRLRDALYDRGIAILEAGGTLGDFIRALKKGSKEYVLRFAQGRKDSLAALPDSSFGPFVAQISEAAGLGAMAHTDQCWNESDSKSLNAIIYSAECPVFRPPQPNDFANYHNLESALSFDIEVADWWTDHPEIYSVSISKRKSGESIVYGLFPLNSGSIAAMNETASYVQVPNEARLLAALSREIRNSQLRITQNGLGYDYPVCNKRPGLFLIGSDNSPPASIAYMRGTMDEHGRQGSSDAVDLDTAYFARFHLSSLLGDFKLETIADLLHRHAGLDTYYHKLQTYEENDALVEEARKGDKEAAGRLMEYTHGDGVVTKRIGEWCAKTIMPAAETLGIEYFDAFHRSPRKIALIASDRLHWKSLNKPQDHHVCDQFLQKFHSRELKELLDKKLEWIFEQGEHKNVLVAYCPLWPHVERFLRHRTGGMIEMARGAKEPLQALIYNQILDGFAAELVADLEPLVLPFLTLEKFYRDFPNTPDPVMLGKYGANKKTIMQALDDSLKQGLKKTFEYAGILNRHENMFFLLGMAEKEAREKGLVPIGTADRIINVEPGRIVHTINEGISSTGILVPGRKKRVEHPGRNSNPALEIMAVHDFAKAYFSSGLEEACRLVTGYSSSLTQGTLGDELLAFKVQQTEPLKDRSPEQQRTRKARIEKKFGLKPGEKVFVGITGTPADEDYVEYDPGTKAYKNSFVPNIGTYLDEIFAYTKEGKRKKSESTLYSIAKSLTIFDDSRKKRVLLADCLASREQFDTLVALIRDKV